VPIRALWRLPWALVSGQGRSFRDDALACVAAIDPPLQVFGREHVPAGGPGLITVNHYSRPGFRAWWIPIAVSAVVAAGITWVATSAWRFENRPLARHALRPLSGWVIRRLAQVYGFSTMPPMPPSPAEVVERAEAVRRLLARVRRQPRPLVGLAPEGSDAPGGVLQWPPAGAGRLVLHLARLGLEITPVSVCEADGALAVRFGPPYRIILPPALSPDERDRQASRIVMQHIALLLPSHLRGPFAC
jgi:hypothetical protein